VVNPVCHGGEIRICGAGDDAAMVVSLSMQMNEMLAVEGQ